jgi:iron-sulfur cluster assembly accessory protein
MLSLEKNMEFPEQTTLNVVNFTLPAANATRDVMSKKNLQDYALRLFIAGGGCSGYQYGLVLDKNIRDDDAVVETDGVKLVIDEVSIKYLQGATVDYIENPTGSGFKITNPNAVSSCDCGQSFNSTEGSSSGSCSCCG